MTSFLCLLFLLSGAAALVFEALWFRLASLTFGSSVWAGSLVLSSFMGGLGLGNALSGRWGERLTRPVRAYALLELVVGVTGLGLVLVLPVTAEWFAPLFRPLLDHPLPLNALRLGLAFAMLLVPTTAMGATLPLLVKALRDRGGFGAVLGRLYGWNTLGGVLGAVGVEAVLVGPLGLRGSAVAAALLNLAAAAGALVVERRLATQAPVTAGPAPARRPATARSRRLLAVAALCGAVLLAFEVVWFRFLQIFVIGTGLNFAVMLATVLLGITLGALLAGRLLGRRPDLVRWLPVCGLAAAFVSAFAYVALDRITPYLADFRTSTVVALTAWLALPTCALSGALFTLLGAALQRETGDDVRATASLTLANTMGGMVGAALGAFLLLPLLGMEGSFFGLACLYVVAAALCLERPVGPRLRLGLLAAGAPAVVLLALFPFGLMANHYLKRMQVLIDPTARLAALREGRTETIQYLRNDFLGEPVMFRMITNRFSMSNTSDVAQRYMRLFVYWALALRPEPEHALLISYGVGNTAHALTEVRSLRSIDVVDISTDVLALAGVPYPPPAVHPLQDPRMRVHVEDGRFFLQTSDRQFDLITAEPPPLKVAGVVSLYTQEYFEHLRGRLAPGGVVTYWLPVYQILPTETHAVVRGFCAAFPDCTLWTAAGLEWMLVGTQGPPRPVDLERFTAPWRDPLLAAQLRDIGIDAPEQLGTTFLADAEQLRAWTGPGVALRDDFPQRLSHTTRREPEVYTRFMEADAARERFRTSRYIAAVWPADLRTATEAAFDWQAHLNALFLKPHTRRPPGFADVEAAVRTPERPALAAWLNGSSPREQAIVERVRTARPSEPLPAGHLALRSLLLGDRAGADELLAAAAREQPEGRWAQVRALNAFLAGDRERAQRLAAEAGVERDPGFAEWVSRSLGPAPDGARNP
ncbi:MAG: spermidine synthase [Vicinamibacteria bacterium]